MSYDVILTDCPWPYRNKKTGGSMSSGALAKYATLSLGQLAALPMANIAAKDAVLFHWATTPLLPDALLIMDEWGFTFKTELVWIKTGRLGMGWWFRNNIEHLLIGVKGKPKPFRSSMRNHVSHRTLRHSEKPAVFHEIIESVTPGARRIELFARKQREGWDATGLELDGLDIRTFLANPDIRQNPLRDPETRKAFLFTKWATTLKRLAA